jgi:hypothetical protein
MHAVGIRSEARAQEKRHDEDEGERGGRGRRRGEHVMHSVLWINI